MGKFYTEDTMSALGIIINSQESLNEAFSDLLQESVTALNAIGQPVVAKDINDRALALLDKHFKLQKRALELINENKKQKTKK